MRLHDIDAQLTSGEADWMLQASLVDAPECLYLAAVGQRVLDARAARAARHQVTGEKFFTLEKARQNDFSRVQLGIQMVPAQDLERELYTLPDGTEMPALGITMTSYEQVQIMGYAVEGFKVARGGLARSCSLQMQRGFSDIPTLIKSGDIETALTQANELHRSGRAIGVGPLFFETLAMANATRGVIRAISQNMRGDSR